MLGPLDKDRFKEQESNIENKVTGGTEKLLEARTDLFRQQVDLEYTHAPKCAKNECPNWACANKVEYQPDNLVKEDLYFVTLAETKSSDPEGLKRFHNG
ncbi:hypothetical protein CSKR_203195 [Clonorchis sinensis]|uniref:Uncharacterized protein n=1 Tax=Clonorchis sinensis TaxID=79923 RepID=A0A8T1M8I6_CLOSI|nr:hypothetical protein CSKR_203195 [Clonorchis sinensis]